MIRRRSFLSATLAVPFVAAIAAASTAGRARAAGPARAADPENTLYMDLKYGRVVIEMLPDIAPHTVARIKQLVREHFYDGLTFHRVIGGFMAQGGDPTGTGSGGSGVSLKAEFSDLPFERGTVAMARSSNPDSADSQFFICYARASHLDGKYTIWGRVVKGMAYVGMLKRGSPADNGLVADPDRIVKMQIAADVKN